MTSTAHFIREMVFVAEVVHSLEGAPVDGERVVVRGSQLLAGECDRKKVVRWYQRHDVREAVDIELQELHTRLHCCCAALLFRAHRPGQVFNFFVRLFRKK